MLTVFGALAVTFMVVMYALERRDRRYTLGFAAGCLLSSVYGFLAGAWPFGVVEVVWAGVAITRYRRPQRASPITPAMRERDAAIHARGQELVALATPHFPQEFDVTGDTDAWPLIGTGMVSRMIGTMKAILAQHHAELEADAGAAVRSLFEQAVYLAWLAADPSVERIQAWKKADLKSRLTADDDARAHGNRLFTGEQRTDVEAQVAKLAGSRLVLASVAEEADRHWAGKLPGMGGQGETKSWRGFYAIVYRNYSGFAHPTFRGLNPVVVDLSPTRKQVRLEEPYEGSGPYGMATVIFGLSLLVASTALGWPKADDVVAIFERYP